MRDVVAEFPQRQPSEERMKGPPAKKRKAGLLGLAFDAEDGQKRITRGPNFFLVGGSQESHEVMRETAVKINERLDSQGRRLEDVSVHELREIVRDIVE
jgi:hypothetical protein